MNNLRCPQCGQFGNLIWVHPSFWRKRRGNPLISASQLLITLSALRLSSIQPRLLFSTSQTTHLLDTLCSKNGFENPAEVEVTYPFHPVLRHNLWRWDDVLAKDSPHTGGRGWR